MTDLDLPRAFLAALADWRSSCVRNRGLTPDRTADSDSDPLERRWAQLICESIGLTAAAAVELVTLHGAPDDYRVVTHWVRHQPGLLHTPYPLRVVDDVMDRVQAAITRAEAASGGSSKRARGKRKGRPPLERDLLRKQVYDRICNEHTPKTQHVDTMNRLKQDRGFLEQVNEAGLTLNVALVRNAIAWNSTRLARNKQQTPTV